MKANDLMRRERGEEGGFSLIEMMIVIAIIMIVAVASTPYMVNVISAARMRGNMQGLATFIQQSRGNAVRTNTPRAIYLTQVKAEYIVYEGDVQAAQPAYSPNGTITPFQMPMGKQVVYIGSPTGSGAPTILNNTTVFGSSTITPQTGTAIGWNTRGMPCVIDTTTGACTTSPATGSDAFIWYFVFQPPLGSNRWSALSVTPAGRIKTWFWDGGAWTN